MIVKRGRYNACVVFSCASGAALRKKIMLHARSMPKATLFPEAKGGHTHFSGHKSARKRTGGVPVPTADWSEARQLFGHRLVADIGSTEVLKSALIAVLGLTCGNGATFSVDVSWGAASGRTLGHDLAFGTRQLVGSGRRGRDSLLARTATKKSVTILTSLP